MAFTESEIAEHTVLLEEEFWSLHRPPLHLRDQIREGQRITDQSIELFFARPAFRRPDTFIEEPIAKIRFNRSRRAWQLYWQRADMKWHVYEPCPETDSLSKALRVIHEDAFCCFFG